MALVLSKVSTLKAELRLAQAISEFQGDLSTEQKAAFRTARDASTRTPPHYQDVMRLTEEIDRNAATLLNSRRGFGPRVTNVLHAIQQFAALGDVLVGGSQNILACGVWSLVRMTLLTAVKFASYLEQLSALLMNIGRSAPRYERLKQLYPQSRALQTHLYEYFIVVVRLCHQMLKLTKRSMFRQVVAFISDTDMKTYQSELDAISALIKEEMTLLMAKEIREQGSGIKSLVRSAEAEAQRERLESRNRVLDSCSTYDYETTRKETRKLGTASWFQEVAEYKNWRASTSSAILICTGKLGSGKSVLLANVVGDLSLHVQTTTCPVAYFFCRHDIADSLQARTVMGSLARQLLRDVADLTKADEEIVSVNTPPFNFSTILHIFRRVLPPGFEAHFVLDGLDECHEQERRDLIRQLRELQRVFTLRVCIACRSDVDGLWTLKPESFSNGSIMVVPEENPEMKQFIRAELIDRIEAHKLVIGDPGLALEIEDALIAGSQGMFLWVALQIQSICTAKTDEAIRRALKELPQSLPETFSRILEKSAHAQSDRHYQIRVFELVIAACRPLTTSEMREALSVIPGDDAWDPARLLNDVMSVLACCGSLVMVDEENFTVRLIHHSVKQYLLGTESRSTEGIVTFEKANRAMRATVFTYLNYGVFDTELTTTTAQQISLEAVPYKIVRSMDTSRSSKIALRLLRSRGSQANVDIGRAVAEAAKQVKPQLDERFHFYAYATSHWLQHAYSTLPEEKATYTMLLKLINRILDSSSSKEEESQRILFWAAGEGEVRVLSLCLAKGINPETKHSSLGTTPLHFAATSGHHSCVEFLVNMPVPAELESHDGHGRTSLSWAAGRGHQRVVELLIAKGAHIESRDDRGWTPLLWASNAGSAAIVETLLAHGADPTVMGTLEGKYQTPASRAIELGHTAVVKVFLDHGLDLAKQLIRDPDFEAHGLPLLGWTPLECAVQANQPDVIRLLVEHGAPIVRTDLFEAAPYNMFLHAVERGHDAAVEVLIETGADLNTRFAGGHTPLSAAAMRAQPAIVKMLIDAGADIESKNSLGYTALFITAHTIDDPATEDRVAAMNILIDHGADREVKDMMGLTVLHWMGVHHNIERIYLPNIERAIKLGFSTETTDSSGRTLLAVAAEKGNLDIVELICRLVTSPAQSDRALLHAARNGHMEIFAFLVVQGARLYIGSTIDSYVGSTIDSTGLEDLLNDDTSRRVLLHHPRAIIGLDREELRLLFFRYAEELPDATHRFFMSTEY